MKMKVIGSCDWYEVFGKISFEVNVGPKGEIYIMN